MTPKKTKPKVLVASLNWGLGHATRCIPIINELHEQGAEVFIGSDGASLSLLQNEFPNAPFVQLPSYNISYGKGGFTKAMLPQIPKIFRNIKCEQHFTDNFVKKHGINAIISDNRYGCRSKMAHSVFLTHQIFLKMPSGLQWLEPMALKVNQSYIHRFNACWVPDFAHPKHNLSGELSHGRQPLGKFYTYIGALSRMKPPHEKHSKKYNLAAIVSGPEPQRTLFENLLLKEFALLPQLTCLLLRGLPDGAAKKLAASSNVEVRNHAHTAEMNELMLQSRIIVARSGYSTLMDLAATGNKAILVPTPGQTEQEYLAKRFEKQRIFQHLPQNQIRLGRALHKTNNYSGLQSPPTSGQLKVAVRALLGEAINNLLVRFVLFTLGLRCIFLA